MFDVKLMSGQAPLEQSEDCSTQQIPMIRAWCLHPKSGIIGLSSEICLYVHVQIRYSTNLCGPDL